MESMEMLGVLAVPLIVGLVEVAKGSGLSTRWAAPVALLLGVALSLAAGDQLIPAAVVRGLTVGLMASGLYSGARAVAGPGDVWVDGRHPTPALPARGEGEGGRESARGEGEKSSTVLRP